MGWKKKEALRKEGGWSKEGGFTELLPVFGFQSKIEPHSALLLCFLLL